MKRLNAPVSNSLHLTLAAAIALPFALSVSGCELIASVDRSLIVEDTGGTAGSSGGDSSTAGAGGQAHGGESGAGDAGESQGGEAGATGGEAGEAGADSAAGGSGMDMGGHGGTSGMGGGSGKGGTSASGGVSGGTGVSGSGGVSGGTGVSGSGGASGGDGASGNGGASGSGGMSGTSGSGGSGPAGKVIYLTSSPKKGNFGGVSMADTLCNASAPPATGPYKALIVDGTTRVACTSANCASGQPEGTDWVLQKNTKYVRADGTTVIGTTNGAAIFSFPLNASIAASGFSYWTGLNSDWTTSADSCSGWTQASGFGNEGLGDASNSGAINGVNESCSTLAGAFLACVEQ